MSALRDSVEAGVLVISGTGTVAGACCLRRFRVSGLWSWRGAGARWRCGFKFESGDGSGLVVVSLVVVRFRSLRGRFSGRGTSGAGPEGPELAGRRVKLKRGCVGEIEGSMNRSSEGVFSSSWGFSMSSVGGLLFAIVAFFLRCTS